MKVALFLLLSGLALVVEGEVFKNTVSVCPKGAKFCCPDHTYNTSVYPHPSPPKFAVVVGGTKKIFTCKAPFACVTSTDVCPAVKAKTTVDITPTTGRHLSTTSKASDCNITVAKTGANLIAMCLDPTKPRFCCSGFTTKRPVYPYECGAPHYAFVRVNGTKVLHTCPSTAYACVSTKPFTQCPTFP